VKHVGSVGSVGPELLPLPRNAPVYCSAALLEKLGLLADSLNAQALAIERLAASNEALAHALLEPEEGDETGSQRLDQAGGRVDAPHL
jgi:hypothetical protein